MMSSSEIAATLADGRVVIEPFSPRHLGPNSYDVRLGCHFFREQKPQLTSEAYNVYDAEDVRRVWGYSHEARASGFDAPGIRRDDRIITLQPGETILAHTEEYIGGREDVTTMMKARSSLGRNFIRVCACAGMGDVGYVNRWTMEIENISRFYTIPLRVGMRVAQITFFQVGESFDYSVSGKYQSSSDLGEVMRSWKPDDMLPRLDRDWEIAAR